MVRKRDTADRRDSVDTLEVVVEGSWGEYERHAATPAPVQPPCPSEMPAAAMPLPCCRRKTRESSVRSCRPQRMGIPWLVRAVGWW